MSSAAPSVGPVKPPAPQRATLEEWSAKLDRLIARRQKFDGLNNSQLCVHLASAIEGAHQAIAEACEPARTALIGEAVSRIAPYFDLPGDARQAAASFPAVMDFTRTLRGASHADDSLDGLAFRAGQAAELIGRIRGGQEFWRYEAGTC